MLISTVLKSITDNSGILQVLQGQVSNHQIAVEKLKKAAEVLLDTRGELTPDKDEIQKTLGKMFAFLNSSFLSLVSACRLWKTKITELPCSYVTVLVRVLVEL